MLHEVTGQSRRAWAIGLWLAMAGCGGAAGTGGDDECRDLADCEPGYACVERACFKVCERGEDCDDLGYDCVDSVCVPPAPGECGNGLLAPGEECDDADTDPEDGCDERCRIEPGWFCADEPSECTLACG